MPIYLDFNASTPVAPEVAAAMQPFLDGHFGNPSSGHWAGQPARDAVETARREVASLLQCGADEVLKRSLYDCCDFHDILRVGLRRRPPRSRG